MQQAFDIYDLLLVGGGIFLFVVGVFVHTAWREHKMAELLRLANKRLGGRVVGKGLGHPELALRHLGVGGAIKFLTTRRPNRRHHTLLVWELPARMPLALHLITLGTQAELVGQPLGAPAPLEHPALAGSFELTTSDPERARLLLDDEAIKGLGRLRTLIPGGKVELLIFERQVVVQLPGFVSRPEQVLGLGFIGRKLLARALAVSGWAGSLPAEAEAHPACAVCGQPIADLPTVCGYCGAAWHPTCANQAQVCPACGAPAG